MANLEKTATVHLVDISDESLKIAKERFFQVYKYNFKRIELKCHKSINDLSEKIDLAIVATNSDVRSEVIREVTQKKVVKNFLLEKVLFQTADEYFLIDDILRGKDIPTWVNCCMREKDFYKKLKTKLNLDKKIQMKVAGSLWAMGSSSIHFIDLFSYLTGCNDFDFIDCDLDKNFINSKRAGFKEFSGRLIGKNSQGHSLTLCRDDGNDPYRIDIINGPKKHEITDCIDHVVYKYFDGEKESIENVEIPFQSQTTHQLVQQIINNGCCDLINYHDSMNLHLPLIRILIHHMQEITGEMIKVCPIT